MINLTNGKPLEASREFREDMDRAAKEAGIDIFYSFEYACRHSVAAETVIEETETAGNGYEGGHNTAARLGWPISHAATAPRADFSVTRTYTGRHTGCRPVTYSYQVVEHTAPPERCPYCGEAFLKKDTLLFG